MNILEDSSDHSSNDCPRPCPTTRPIRTQRHTSPATTSGDPANTAPGKCTFGTHADAPFPVHIAGCHRDMDGGSSGVYGGRAATYSRGIGTAQVLRGRRLGSGGTRKEGVLWTHGDGSGACSAEVISAGAGDPVRYCSRSPNTPDSSGQAHLKPERFIIPFPLLREWRSCPRPARRPLASVHVPVSTCPVSTA